MYPPGGPRSQGRRRCSRSAPSTASSGTSAGSGYNAPVHRLLGGPVRESIPGLRQRARLLARTRQGRATGESRSSTRDSAATKVVPALWSRPMVATGMARKSSLAETLRDAIGPDNDFMLDAWMSWSVPYTVAMAERLAQSRPRWIEEPVMPDLMVEGCAEIRSRINVPIATGEHEYTRWGIKLLLDAGSARSAPTRHLLGRRHHRDGEDLRPRLLLRRSRHPSRPLVHANIQLTRRPADPLCATRRIPDQVANPPSVLPGRHPSGQSTAMSPSQPPPAWASKSTPPRSNPNAN